MYSPRDSRLTGTLTLSAKTDVNEIHSITYGIKTKTQLLSEYDEHGAMVDPVLYEYYKHKARNMKELKEMLQTFDGAREVKDIYLTDNNLIYESTSSPSGTPHQNSKFIKDHNGHWSLPKGETIALNFNITFPSPDEWYLPSTADRFIDLKAPYNGSIQIEYSLYVKIQRQSTILKRIKDKEYRHGLIYQAGSQFPSPITYYSYRNNKTFKNKLPKPELIDSETGCYESGNITSKSMQPKFIRKLFSPKKEGINIPIETILSVRSMVSMYEPLFTQLDLKFHFDFSQLDYPNDFSNSKSSTGLGLFQIESLKLYVLYATCLNIDDEKFRSDQPPQKFHEFKFNSLVFDMRDCTYNAKKKRGSMKIPQTAFSNQSEGSSPLIDIIKTPLLCSCDIFETIRNFTTLQFVWTIVDSDHKLKCTFVTEATLTAELEDESGNVPSYEDISYTPAYEEKDPSPICQED